jgi:large conductance mechanosensitive channel
MPPIGMALGRVDFSSLFVALNGGTYASLAEAKAAGAPTLNYGLFLNTCLEFLIVAFAVFLLVKQVNRLKGPVIVDTRACPFCMTQIPMKATRCPGCTSEVKPAA